MEKVVYNNELFKIGDKVRYKDESLVYEITGLQYLGVENKLFVNCVGNGVAGNYLIENLKKLEK